jgi:peptide deformylase
MVPNVQQLKIITYPDPRLRKVAAEVAKEEFGEELRDFVSRMFELMREDGGVGLAAPQVGVLKRIFVMNHTGKEGDDRVYINPILSDPEDSEKGEEGCLSLPGIRADILRDFRLTCAALDINGNPFTETDEGYRARVWQHEFDHLNGALLLDRMGPVARMAHRKKIKELEAKFIRKKEPPTHPRPPSLPS